jgi:hypothetical protein
MTQSLKVIFFMQEKTKVGRRGANQEFHEKITTVPPKPNKVQTRASKSRQINPGRDEGLSVRKARQRKERS